MKRTLFSMTTLILALVLAAPVQAATPVSLAVFHVTEIHDHVRTKDEESFSKALHTRIYKGTIGGRAYTIEEPIVLFAPGSHFHVGQDYEVTKLEDRIGKTIKIAEKPDKNGKVFTAWLTVTNIEEITK